MNITEFMDFDFAWFTTLPGILITGGVVVLLIALIIFIASNKKDKKKAPDVAEVGMPASNINMDNGMGAPLDNSMNAVPDMGMNNMVSNVSEPMGFNSVPLEGTINGVNPGMMNNGPMSVNDFSANGVVNPEPVMPKVGSVSNDVVSAPAVEINPAPSYNEPVTPVNVVDFSTPAVPNVNASNVNDINMPSAVIPESAPVAEATPVVQPTPVDVPSVAEQQPVVTERPAIYGGVDPSVIAPSTPIVNEPKPVIYGGADPLEHTTTLPRMTHEAYNVGAPSVSTTVVNEVPAVEPVAIQHEPTPVQVQPTVEVQPSPMPSVEPVMPSVMPQVEQPVSPMPMTGAEMFQSNDASANTTSSGNGEIETLEF
mgnify:FL=1